MSPRTRTSQKAHSNIDLNKAGVEELAKLPMLGRKRAEQIIEYRDEHGPFKSWDDVDGIPGISEGLSEKLRQAGVRFGGPEKKAA